MNVFERRNSVKSDEKRIDHMHNDVCMCESCLIVKQFEFVRFAKFVSKP